MKERTYISLDEQMAWSQSKEAEKSAFADTVGNVNTIEHTSLQAALQANDKDYAKEAKQAEITTEKDAIQKVHDLEVQNGVQRDRIERNLEQLQKKELNGVQIFDKKEQKEIAAQHKDDLNGKDAKALKKALKIDKSDVKGLEGMKSRQTEVDNAAPSDRKGTSLQSRIGLHKRIGEKKKELHKEQEVQKEVKAIEKTSDKDMVKTDKKISKERLQMLSGRKVKHTQQPAVARSEELQKRIDNAANRVQNAEIARRIQEKQREQATR